MDDEEDDHDVPSCESEEEQNSQKEKNNTKSKSKWVKWTDEEVEVLKKHFKHLRKYHHCLK